MLPRLADWQHANRSQTCYSACTVAASIALLLLLGCARNAGELETAPVSGRVTLEGRPIPWGVVTFTPSKGRSATGLIQVDGEYRLSTYGNLDGAPIGDHEVTVIYTDQKPDVPKDPVAAVPMAKWLIPQRYGQPGLSGLSFHVEAGVDNVADFDLKKQ